jgi:hypothetical protein
MPYQLGQAPTVNREENQMVDDTKSAVSVAKKYSCEVLLEKTSYEVANDKSFPTDAKLITYVYNGQTYMDLTRSAKDVRLFDLYYDTYGPGAVQKIEFGFGSVNPKTWGYEAPETKKRR